MTLNYIQEVKKTVANIEMNILENTVTSGATHWRCSGFNLYRAKLDVVHIFQLLAIVMSDKYDDNTCEG